MSEMHIGTMYMYEENEQRFPVSLMVNNGFRPLSCEPAPIFIYRLGSTGEFPVRQPNEPQVFVNATTGKAYLLPKSV